MKKLTWILGFAFVGLILLVPGKKFGKAQEQFSSGGRCVPNEVLVKFKEETDKGQIITAINSLQGKVVTYLKNEIYAPEWDSAVRSQRSFLDDPHLIRVRVPESVGTELAISLLKQLPDVVYAEPNGIPYFFTNDPHWSKLWGMHNTGQTGGTSGADIHAPEAWNIFTGSPNITVAVIDSGIDYNHEDLAANFWTNPGETGGGKETDGIDNDGDGYVDDWRGWDFATGDNDPIDEYDPYYHGTHVSGTIGAVGNNGIGVAGVCWSVKLMALRFFNIADTISAIDYAANKGARVINASWGTGAYSQALYDAIQRARSKGVLFIAAAGNWSNLQWYDNDAIPVYPASYALDNILAVLSTDHNDNLSSFSHYGKMSVDIGAPGGTGDGTNKDIYSTKRYNAYQYLSGTSMSTPHVVGVAALALGKCPQLTYSQLKSRILNKSDYDPALQNKCVSNGRLNAYNVIYDPAVPDGTPASLTGTYSSWTTVSVSWQDNSSNEIGFDIQRKKTGESDFYSIKSVDSGVTGYLDTSAWGGIPIYYKVRAYNMAGTSPFSGTLTITIPATVPAAPSNLHTVGIPHEFHVQLNWTDNANNEQWFLIERRPEGSESWTQIGIIAGNSSTFIDTTVHAGTYSYRVGANNPYGTSYSNVIQVEVIGQ